LGLEQLLPLIVVGAAVSTVATMFLPAALELKRPKDSGPRLIGGCYEVTRISRVINIEEVPLNRKRAVLPQGFLDFLPSLE